MILKQYYLGCLAHASYLIADERTRVAAVVDPQRDVDQYLADARELGVTIQHVFLTHFHADFVAGHLELRDKAGARIHLGARAEAEFDFTPAEDGDVIEFGDVRLSILETPGHTPEGISIVVHDLAQSEREPQAVLTGDTLFIGDVGRPDLLASIGVSQAELASMLYDSLHAKLLKLPDSTLVYPAHGAGSMCGKKLSSETVSTLGEQRRYNYALQPMTKEQFTALVTAEQPDAPAYFGYDAVLNRKERPTLEQSLERSLIALRPEEALAHANRGAQVLDVRSAVEYAGGHLAGSLNVGLDGSFATWAGSLLDPARPIVVVAEAGRERETATRLARIGFDRVAGYVAGGMAAFAARPDLVRTSQRVTAQALAELLVEDPTLRVVDVRTPGEWQAGHVADSVNLPLNRLRQRMSELPRDRALAVICRTGYRSSLAASLLAQAGFERILDVTGGIEAWRASRLPVAAPAAGCGA